MDPRHELDQEIQRRLFEEHETLIHQAELDLSAERAYQDVLVMLPKTNVKLPLNIPYNKLTYEEFLSSYSNLSRQQDNQEYELWPLIKSVETLTSMRHGMSKMAIEYLDDLLSGTSLDNAANWINIIYSLSDDRRLIDEYLGADHPDYDQLKNKQQEALIKKERYQRKYVLIRAIRQASTELLVENFGLHDNTTSLVSQIINYARPNETNDILNESVILPPEISRLCDGYIPYNHREKYIGIVAVEINQLLREIEQ